MNEKHGNDRLRQIQNAERVVIICNGPFQIMLAIHVRRTILKKVKVDLIVTNHTKDYEEMAKNIDKTNVFDNVNILKVFSWDHENISNQFSRLQNITKSIMRIKTIGKEKLFAQHYDYLIFFDFLRSTNDIYSALKKYNNNKIKAVYLEEGVNATLLFDLDGTFCLNKKNNIKCKIKEILGICNVRNGLYAGFTAIKNKIIHQYYFPFYSIPAFSHDDQQYIQIINRIWKYSPEMDYKEKYIFFESASRVDKTGADEISIVRDLAEWVGKDNLIVKLHPRSVEDPYSPLGVHVSNDSSIPWQVFTLNSNKEHVLIALNSTCLIYSQIYWGIKQQSIMLMNCRDYKQMKIQNNFYKVMNQIVSEGNLCKLPESKEEFKRMITTNL